MSDSDGSPQPDDRHNRPSRFRSPVSPGCAVETLEEREEQRLAEAAVPVRPPAGQPRLASADTGSQPRGLSRPRRPPPPPKQQALPPRPGREPQAHRGLRPQPQQAAPRPRPRPPARRQRGG